MKRKGYRLRGVLRKRGAKARVDEQKPDTRRERGTSSLLTAKSISIKNAERKSGDCARKAAELTSGDLLCVAQATERAERHADRRQKSAEGIVGHGVGKASEALRSERWSKQIGQAGNGDRSVTRLDNLPC